MKLKYYLRGLGIGIIITTIILMISNSGYTKELTDEEIIARAEQLGMVMKEDPLFSNSKLDKNSENTVNTEEMNESEATVHTEKVEDSEVLQNSEGLLEAESETEKESESEAVDIGDVYRLIIPAGSMPRSICNELEENGVIESAESLRLYLGEVGYAKVIKVGEYDIPYGATNEEVYEILKDGPI